MDSETHTNLGIAISYAAVIAVIWIAFVLYIIPQEQEITDTIRIPAVTKCVSETYRHYALPQEFELCIREDSTYVYRSTTKIDSSFYYPMLQKLHEDLTIALQK